MKPTVEDPKSLFSQRNLIRAGATSTFLFMISLIPLVIFAMVSTKHWRVLENILAWIVSILWGAGLAILICVWGIMAWKILWPMIFSPSEDDNR